MFSCSLHIKLCAGIAHILIPSNAVYVLMTEKMKNDSSDAGEMFTCTCEQRNII